MEPFMKYLNNGGFGGPTAGGDTFINQSFGVAAA